MEHITALTEAGVFNVAPRQGTARPRWLYHAADFIHSPAQSSVGNLATSVSTS